MKRGFLNYPGGELTLHTQIFQKKGFDHLLRAGRKLRINNQGPQNLREFGFLLFSLYAKLLIYLLYNIGILNNRLFYVNFLPFQKLKIFQVWIFI